MWLILLNVGSPQIGAIPGNNCRESKIKKRNV